MVIEGVDYAWNGPSASALVAAGKHFACRYGGPGSDGKQLHADELAELRAHGIDVVANAEGVAGAFRSYAVGASWAQQAIDHFGPLGIPAGRPIYFSVDWDAGSGDWAGIDAACRGAASVIGPARVGVYGSFATIEHCAAAGIARWFWQTYAWSGGRWSSHAHIQQYRNGVTIDGADCDLNRAMVDDFGQWNYQGDDVNLTDKYGDDAWPARTLQNRLKDDAMLRDVLWGDPQGTKVAQLDPSSPLAKLIATPAQVAALSAKVDALAAQVKASGQVVIPQAQLDLAVLNALKTLAAGPSA